MDREFEVQELTLSDIFLIFRKRLFWFLGVFIATVVFTIVYLVVATPIYEASVTIKIESSYQSTLADVFSTSFSYTGRPDISTEIELIKSRTNLEKVIQELNLLDRMRKKNPDITMDAAIKALNEWITVSPVKNTKIVKISVQHPDPFLATNIANKLAEKYNELLRDLSKNQYTAKRKFIEEQIPKIEDDLKRIEEEIRKFKEKNNVFILDEEAKWLLQMLSRYDSQLNSVNIQIDETKARIKAIKDLLSKTDQKIVSSETISMNPVVLQLKQKLTDLNVELSGLLATYPETNSKVVAVKRKIAETEQLLKKEVEKIITSQVQTINPVYSDLITELSSEEASLQVLIANKKAVEKIREEYQNKIAQLPSIEQQLLEMQRDLKVKENLYMLLLEKLEETRIAEAGVIGNAQIVDKANVPTIPVKPNKKLTLAIGGVLGIFLGILIVFIVEYLDKTLKGEEEIQRIVPEVPIVGRVPSYEPDKRRATGELVVKNHPTSPVSESFKLIATNLLFMDGAKKQVVAVTSPGPGEGKSFIAANVAVTFAQNGFKTLILDLDMRKPRVEKVLGLGEKAKVGIVNHIFRGIPIEEITIHFMENLDIIPVGPLPPNPTIVLTNPKFSEILEKLKDRYDKIVIDLPPVLAAADPLIVGKHANGILLVVRAATTQRSSLKIAFENIKTSGNRLLGIVVNDISQKYSAYYYYYYYYYTKTGEKVKRKRRKKLEESLMDIFFRRKK